MKIKEEEKKEDQTDAALVSKLNQTFESYKKGREKNEWEWFIQTLWYMGYQNAKYDKKTKQIVNVNASDKVTVNKIWANIRGVRNYLTRNKPKWDVTPYNQSQDEGAYKDDTLKSNKYVDYLYEHEELRPKLKQVIADALVTSRGYMQVLWNSDAEDGDGEIDFSVVDPFDLYKSSRCTRLANANHLILAVRRSLEEMEASGIYDKEKIALLKTHLTTKTSENAYKEQLLSIRGDSTTSGDEGILLQEHWFYEYKEADEGGRKKKVVKIVTLVDDIIIRNEETDFKKLPFYELSSDVQSREPYGFGWVKFLIPIQKEINKLLQSMADYNSIVNKARLIVERGANIKSVTNEHGEMIFVDPGSNVRPLNNPTLEQTVFQEYQLLGLLFEDIGAMNEATRGRLPSAGISGKALEILQVGDANSMSELVENLEDFLKDLGEAALELASQKYSFARTILPKGASGTREFLKVIGASASQANGIADEKTIVIPEKNLVDVKIGSYLADSNEARREILKELFNLQAIDQETLLKGYEVSNVAEIIAKTKAAKQEVAAQEAEAEAMKQQATTPQVKEEGVRAAIAAIKAVVSGQTPVMPTKPSQQYIDYLSNWLKSESGNLDQATRQSVEAFINQVLQLAG